MFKLYFATPDKKVVVDVELEDITLPAYKGELNILPGHAPLMTTLEAGILRYKLKNGESKKMAISWGYCQVSAEGVTVLAETAVEADEIDTKVVKEHLVENEQKLVGDYLNDADWDRVQNEIARLRSELDLVGESKNAH
jgi:F-type H+-transporting ATPase subunit epsilon